MLMLRSVGIVSKGGGFCLLLFCLGLVGCSGSGRTTSDQSDGNDDGSRINLADYEIFDVAPYRDEATEVENQVDHEVPEALMQSRADSGIVQIVSGYRVQVFSSLDRGDAVLAEEEFRTWWANLTQEALEANQFPESLSIYNSFKQPLYRVRIGDFTLRSDAKRLMTFMVTRFATVFVVPDQVTIIR